MDRVRHIIIALLMLLGEQTHAEFFCSAESTRDAIFFRDASGKSWQISNFRFEKSSYLGSYLSCARFVEQIPKSSKGVLLTPLYPYSNNIARLVDQDGLLSLCARTPGCRLPWIQNFFHPVLAYESWRKPSVFDQQEACVHSVTRLKDEVPEAGVLPQSDALPLRKVWSIPEQALDEEFFKLLDRERPATIYLSSMIFSDAILERLDQWLLRNTQSTAWVFFSYNLHVLEPGFPLDFKNRSGRLNLFPVFQTPFAAESYHIKGAALAGKRKTTLLMSVNFRRFREEKVADRVFEFEGDQAFESYLSILSQVLNSQCSDRHLLGCSNALRFGLNDRRSELIKTWIERGCQQQFRFQVEQPVAPLFSRVINDKLAIDTERHLLKRLNDAKSSIVLSTHILTESKLTHALIDAKKRGVKVRVLVGTPIEDRRLFDRLKNEFEIVEVTKASGVTSHAKFLVFDHASAVWGTGNFTQTSVHNPWEIILDTRDPKFISELNSYFEKTVAPRTRE